MKENLTGLVKIVGITVLLLVLWGMLAWWVPDKFLQPNNIENLLRRTALFGILGIGVAFVIISAGIDLSIGSLVCFTACLLALFLQVDYAPYVATDVYEIRADQKQLVVASGEPFQIGQTVRYYGGRRARNALLTVQSIRSVDQDGRQRTIIDVDKPLTRDDRADDANRSVGKPTAAVILRKKRNRRIRCTVEIKRCALRSRGCPFEFIAHLIAFQIRGHDQALRQVACAIVQIN